MRTRTTWQQGEKHPKAKLTDEQVRAICRALDKGFGQQQLACEYGVSDVAISHINTGATWAHVTGRRRAG